MIKFNMEPEVKLSYEVWLSGLRKDRYEWLCNMTMKYLKQSKFKDAIINLDWRNSITYNSYNNDIYHITITRRMYVPHGKPDISSLEFDIDRNSIIDMIQSVTKYRIDNKHEIFTEKACFPLVQFKHITGDRL